MTTHIYGWHDRTVAGILDNEVYLGHPVNCKTAWPKPCPSCKNVIILSYELRPFLRFATLLEKTIDRAAHLLKISAASRKICWLFSGIRPRPSGPTFSR